MAAQQIENMLGKKSSLSYGLRYMGALLRGIGRGTRLAYYAS